MLSDLSRGASAPIQLSTTNPGELQQATAEGGEAVGHRQRRFPRGSPGLRCRGNVPKPGSSKQGRLKRAGHQRPPRDGRGTGAPRELPSCAPPALRTPLTPCRSRSAGPNVPAPRPRRPARNRVGNSGPAAWGSAVLTFLPPRKSLRRVPLRPPQSPPSPPWHDRRVSPKSSFPGPGTVPYKGPGACVGH